MAAYTTVSWQKGDEVTSTKLQQMAQNEQWLKDNAIVGNLNYIASALGAPPAGRSLGIHTATRLEAIRVDYDSQVPVSGFIVKVNLPPVFTEPPIIASSHSTIDFYTNCMLYVADRTDYCEFHISHRDGQTVHLRGQLHIICMGR